MLNLEGPYFKGALDSIQPTLDESDRKEAVNNASQVVSAVVGVMNETEKKAENKIKADKPILTGLVYGRIQSGKTRMMITSTALAFDNGFRIVVVITSNNNRLVGQTHKDFQNGLPGSIRIYSKTHFAEEIGQAKHILASGNGGIVLICSKGSTRLHQAIEFLQRIEASTYPAIIFDDEGDQATLDTNNLARSTKDPQKPSSRINQLIHDPAIHSLRDSLANHVFVSVTGTPSGIVLQNIDSSSRPSFIELLKPGRDYIGGEVFFHDANPSNKLITLIDEDERINLLEGDLDELPDGLKASIRFFLLAAAAAGTILGWPTDNTGYKFLCHPSVKTADQDKVANAIRNYLNELTEAFSDNNCSAYSDLKASYDLLKEHNQELPSFEELISMIDLNFNSREILLLNSNTTGEELNYSRYFNFLIGGNTLGRGLAIKKLLVTYYVREAKIAQMDTMYQHARMFGYRKDTIPFTKVFLPPQLYERFRQIYISDEELRTFIELHKDPKSFPVRVANDIRPTRKCVLDARKVDILIPGRQIYPNYPYYQSPIAEMIYDRIVKQLKKFFSDFKENNKFETVISTSDAKKILSLVRTKGTNVWNDKKMPTILSYLEQQFGSEVTLKFRPAERTAGENGLLEQGILTGSDVTADASSGKPVLWLFRLTFKETNKPADWSGLPFIYPTLIIPENSSLFVYNKS